MKTKHRPCLDPSISGGSQHSILKGASDLIKVIAKIPGVEKIRPSFINPAASGKQRVKIVETRPFGLHIKITGNDGCQFFNIITKSPAEIARTISEMNSITAPGGR